MSKSKKSVAIDTFLAQGFLVNSYQGGKTVMAKGPAANPSSVVTIDNRGKVKAC